MKKILAIETSCDDTAVAITNESGEVLADVIFSQIKEHAPYGGVVPEIGSRAHIEQIRCVVAKAFSEAGLNPGDISFVAATFAPGLIGPLLVGAQFAKGFAQAQNIPLIAVHHIEGHVMVGYLEAGFPSSPFLSLIASGGHSAIYHVELNNKITLVGETLDDAAGEAFDKVGRALGLPYPAGKEIDRLAQFGDRKYFDFPVAMSKQKHFNFSFSGLKTKALQTIRSIAPLDEQTRANFCASLQEALCRALCEKALSALKKHGLLKLAAGGGVVANSRLREMLSAMCIKEGVDLYLPKKRYCTDNAVMIGRAALVKIQKHEHSSCLTHVHANLDIEQKNQLTK